MNKAIILIVFLLTLIVGFGWGSFYPSQQIVSSDEKTVIIFDKEGSVAGTGSMEPGIHKGDKLFYRKVGENELLWTGDVYIYKKNETNSIIHRLISIYIGEDGEEYLIFKGDNNAVADAPILREKVEYALIGSCLRHERGLCG